MWAAALSHLLQKTKGIFVFYLKKTLHCTQLTFLSIAANLLITESKIRINWLNCIIQLS